MLGIFGFNTLDRNRDQLQAASIDGVHPGCETIEPAIYPPSRRLYLYVKPPHARVVPGLNEFVEALISPRASGSEGYLTDRGLPPLPAAEQEYPTVEHQD